MRRSAAFAAALGGTLSCSIVPPQQGALPPASAQALPARAATPAPLPRPLPATPIDAAPAQGADIALSRPPQQGAVLVGRAPAGTREVRLNGAPVPLAADGAFLIAFDRDAENAATLEAELANGRIIQRYLPVTPGNWQIEHVNASPTGGVTTAEFQRRRAGELARINAARRLAGDSTGWRQRFRWPLRGRISGLFGAQRIYRGSPGSYHSGTDIAGAAGTPFFAPADGTVILAAGDAPFTLEGHLLMIDHGMGLNSAFLHASKLAVREGDRVRQGQLIGFVGMTGRTTGPHLHWGMKWRQSRVDPMKLAGPME